MSASDSEVRAMRKSGMSLIAIAKATGIHKMDVRDICLKSPKPRKKPETPEMSNEEQTNASS